MKRLDGKNVVITGASSGIGLALAKAFAGRGANVLLAARREDKLREACEAIARMGAGGLVTYETVDLASEESVRNLSERLLKRFEGQRLDYLVLNAGMSQRALALDTSYEVDRELMQVNFLSPVLLTKCLKPLLLSGCRLAVTSSISGLFGFPLRSSYCASKSALLGFFEALELEYPPIGVTFLIPGRIQTDISLSARLADGKAYGQMDPGQANGMKVDRCAKIALRAILKGRHRRLIGGSELLMVYIRKYIPCLFYRLARKVSAK